MSVAGDLTDIFGRLQAIEGKIDKIFGLMDELMRDQIDAEKRLDQLEKEQLLRGVGKEAK